MKITRGNIDSNQLQARCRQGDGEACLMWSGGPYTPGNLLAIGADGGAEDSGYPASAVGGGGGGTSLYTPPALADFPTWVNQLTTSISSVSGVPVLRVPKTESGAHCVARPIPRTPYRIVFGFNVMRGMTGNSGAGVYLHDSISDKMVALYSRAGITDIRYGTFATPAATATTAADYTLTGNQRYWTVLEDDGANRNFYVGSERSIAYAVLLRSEANNTWIVPTHYGFGGFANSVAQDTVVACFDWQEILL